MNIVPKKVNAVLNTYFALLDEKLPNFLDGYYLFGSTSLDAFDEGSSDIDFIAVVKNDVQESEFNILKEIHHIVHQYFPLAILDGMYVKGNHLSSMPSDASCLRFNDGEFQGLQKFDPNSIDAFQLKKYGITVKGKKIEEYQIELNWDVLINNMRENLNTYWVNWLNRGKTFPAEEISMEMIEWGVLGVTRLYYTFREKDMISKVGGGEYALKTLPESWHKIINEAMRLRKNNEKSYYHTNIARRNDALEYMEMIIKECNDMF